MTHIAPVLTLLLGGMAGIDLWLAPHPLKADQGDTTKYDISLTVTAQAKLKNVLFQNNTVEPVRPDVPLASTAPNAMGEGQCPNAREQSPRPANTVLNENNATDHIITKALSDPLAFSAKGEPASDLTTKLPLAEEVSSPLSGIGKDDLLLDLVFDGFDRPGGVNAALSSLVLNSVLSQVTETDIADNSILDAQNGPSEDNQSNGNIPISNDGPDGTTGDAFPLPDPHGDKQTGTGAPDDQADENPTSPLPPLLPQNPVGSPGGPSDPVPVPGAFLLMATGLAALRILNRKFSS
ncbi:MAG: hypothetical protein AAF723_05575 [Pseudomonadota bacterium]